MSDNEEDYEALTEVPAKWKCLEPLLTKKGPFAKEGFEPDPDNFSMLSEARILCVGAGGLGCEILKNLALSGFSDIEVIDLDTIDISNLNRQFLFREKDVNQPKSKCAAEFIMNRCKGVNVKWHNKPIQDFDKSYYTQFNVIIAGLDNVAARCWLNETVHELVKYDEDGAPDWDTIIPLIDGGTEGFKGQSRLIVPTQTSCFECSLSSMTPQTSYPSCTIRNVPRLPEHCIIYALKVNWPRLISFTSPTEFEEKKVDEKEEEEEEELEGGVTLDKDNLEHMSWLYNKALERAKEFGITGVTFTKTQQVVKNIIPAIASTNALVSAACTNEAFKYVTWTSQKLDNYYMYLGHCGISGSCFRYATNPECPVCKPVMFAKFKKEQTLSELLKWLSDDKELGEIKTMHNALSMDSIYLVMASGSNDLYKQKEAQPLSEIMETDTLLRITSVKTGQKGRKVYVKFS